MINSELKKIGGRKPSRSEKALLTREAIYRAAAEVVGKEGYMTASISKITSRAGIAQGTFYSYFDSRQDLFDQLLPHMGEELIEYLHDRVTHSRDFFEVEERGFRAFFEFLQTHPSFFRVLNEAEVVAPIAYKRHFNELVKHYLKSMGRSVKLGQIKNFKGRELEALVYMLMAARSYLYLRYIKNVGKQKPKKMPQWLVEAYMKFVRDGID